MSCFYKYVDIYLTVLKVFQLSLHILQLDPMFLVDCETNIGRHLSPSNVIFIGGIISLSEVLLAFYCLHGFFVGKFSISGYKMPIPILDMCAYCISFSLVNVDNP